MPYAVIQDGYAVFGTGNTKEEAINDARQWVDNPDALDDLKDRPSNVGAFYITDCTEALVAEVEKHGGNIRLATKRDGTACLPSEDDHD